MAESIGEAEDVVPTRPVKESVGEIAAFGTAACLLVLGLIGANGDGFFSRAPLAYLTRAADIGGVVIDHVGWEFGVIVPVLLGFYVLVLGGRQTMGLRRTSAVRRNLSIAAELLAASLAPAFILVLASVVTDYRRAGALVAMVPVMLLTVFLAAQLGCFMAFDDDEKLDAAKRDRAWARQRLAAVRSRSQRPVPVVVMANALFGTGVGVGLYVLSGGWPVGLSAAVGIAAVCAMLGVYGGFGIVRDRYRAKTVIERATGYVLTSMVVAAVSLLGILMWVNQAPAVATCATCAFTVVAISAFIPLGSSSSSVLKNWTLRGAAARSVARQLAQSYARSTREIRNFTAVR
ncbi:hypothetical protein [Clavibacter michiganensis]|uniref:hypothetical protein n=1 Tax=Clavibacter michiganensis TaxID=28447 RepID=UPI001269A66A|nr:hypothetical protein [Clavibacter michiganensis]